MMKQSIWVAGSIGLMRDMHTDQGCLVHFPGVFCTASQERARATWFGISQHDLRALNIQKSLALMPLMDSGGRSLGCKFWRPSHQIVQPIDFKRESPPILLEFATSIAPAQAMSNLQRKGYSIEAASEDEDFAEHNCHQVKETEAIYLVH